MRSPPAPRARLRRLLLATGFLLVFAASPPPAAATEPRPAASAEPPAATGAAPTPEVSPESPRASVKRYLELCRAGEYAEAAEYLDLPDNMRAEGPTLARKLKAVLDRQIWVKLEDISPASMGKGSEKLPPGVEEIGSVPGRTGQEPVRLVRRRGPDGIRWIFSRSTVERIPDWYSRLRDRWLQDYLPSALVRSGPQELMWWQWIALPLLFGAALGIGRLLGYATRRLLGRLARGATARWDGGFLARLSAPLTLAWALVAVSLALPILGLYPPAEAFIERVIRAGFMIALVWAASRGIDALGARALDLAGAKGNPAARSLVPLGAKIVKIVVIAMAAIAALSELGYPVTSLVAGLGISGVALALAAQKTVENLFGSISIGVDQPFRVGDLVTVDGVLGTVESIGLRSTRIRTPDRTLVTFPNGKLAEMRIESFASRDRLRFFCVLGLSRDSRADAVRKVLEGARALLQKEPKVWPEISVSLARIAESSLDVEISAWFSTTDGVEFTRLQEDMLLRLLDLVERAGAELASPTHKLQITRGAEGLPTSW